MTSTDVAQPAQGAPTGTGAPALRFKNLSMVFPDGTHAVDNVSFDVRPGEFVTVVGPSGCGKSTLLRIASSLQQHTGGTCEVDRSSIGYVFQDATLLPWRTVQRNIELNAELQGMDKATRLAKTKAAIELVNLVGHEAKYPKQLSGGMKMRCSLARSLVLQPKVFLFDEPFGALDEITRERLNDELLRLFRTVSKKTLRISKTFGIEGRKLLTPEDDYQALKEFTDAYEGTLSPLEAMHLELQALLKAQPELEAHLKALPGKVFSGKQHPQQGRRAVFFCYALPARPVTEASADDQSAWTLEAGYVQWYLLDLDKGLIAEEAPQIGEVIRCTPETPRHCEIAPTTLKQAREKIEKHIKNTYLKKVQAPLGVEPVLRAWMEIN
jgi:NitT/TauT family transport system ATP-binding protein